MNCKYCGNEMEVGNLKTEGGPGLIYMPEGKNYGLLPTTKKIEKEGGIFLGGPYITRFNKTSVDCHLCKSCRKIVVSY